MDAYFLLCFILIFALTLSSIFLSHRLIRLEKYFKFVCKNVYDEIDK